MTRESLFSLSEHLERLSQDGDPLEVLDATVDFEYFRGWLVGDLGYGDGSKGVQILLTVKKHIPTLTGNGLIKYLSHTGSCLFLLLKPTK